MVFYSIEGQRPQCALLLSGEYGGRWRFLSSRNFGVDSEDVVVSAYVVRVGGGGVIKSLFESSGRFLGCKGQIRQLLPGLKARHLPEF